MSCLLVREGSAFPITLPPRSFTPWILYLPIFRGKPHPYSPSSTACLKDCLDCGVRHSTFVDATQANSQRHATLCQRNHPNPLNASRFMSWQFSFWQARKKSGRRHCVSAKFSLQSIQWTAQSQTGQCPSA